MAALQDEKPATKGPFVSQPWFRWGFPAFILLVIVAAVVGGVVGTRKSSSSQETSSTLSDSGGSATSSAAGAGGSPSSNSSTTAASGGGTTNVHVTDLPLWDWSKDKAIGMCLGNWLTLERWMDEDWFVGLAGNDSVDEWTFSKSLGPDASKTALSAHFNSWITESDIDLMYKSGINHLRIPTGFWAWIPTVAGEPYVQAGQLDQLNRILALCYARGMYVLLDLHGLPGSQNGEESSGQLTTNPNWFGSAVNQQRSDAAVLAVLDFVAKSPYRSVISGLEVINEPRPYTTDQYQTLLQYYTRSYDAIQSSPWPITMFLHPGFIPNGFSFWLAFSSARATSPPSLVIEDHPYPGNFPPQNNSADILSQVCTAANKYLSYPIPVAITEWSIYTGIKSGSFESAFYESQLVAWAWSAGGMYWSFKVISSVAQLAQGLDYSQYSFLTLVQNSTGTIPTPASSLTNTTTRANAAAYLTSLSGNCGPIPDTASPYNSGVAIPSWTAAISARGNATVTS